MLISRQTDYAIRCILALAQDRGRILNAREIARGMHIPQSFLAKILQKLVRRGLVRSQRGVQGGFRLAQPPARLSLWAVVQAVQGSVGINLCALNRRRCRRGAACTVHPVWAKMRREIEQRLKKQSVFSLLKR
jgi:Rrf2 family protein